MQAKLLNPDLGYLLLRISTGGLLIFHGIHKAIHGHAHIQQLLTEHGLPTWLWYGVPIGEILAPALLIIGFLARFSGLIIAFTLAVAIYLAFGLPGFELTQSGGIRVEYDLYYIFVGIAIFFTGSGKYSIYRGGNAWLR